MYQWKKELVAAEGGGTVQIARWFLATNQDGLEAEFEWPILIRKLPKTPELDMFLTIDEMGRVTRVALGWRLSRLGGGCGLSGATPLGLGMLMTFYPG